jgi:Tfp pilus assembly protein PilF
MKSYQQIRCQRCRAVNPLGEELCGQCGTRLMLVVEPSAWRFEEEVLAASQQEELFGERISAMEHGLKRVISHLERGTDLVRQQTQILTRGHLLVQALIKLLSKSGVIDLDELTQVWEAYCENEAERDDKRKFLEEMHEKIVQSYHGRRAKQFAQLVNEAFAAFRKNDQQATDDGWLLLERAAALAPESAPLVTVLARHYFLEGQAALARKYLERACRLTPDDVTLCLFLAITRGDEGDSARARALLQRAEQLDAPDFVLPYARGRLLAHEGRWREALAQFKRALAERDEPEAHYAVALAAYQLNYLNLAARHINKALAADDKYVAAHNLLGLIYRKSGEAARARQVFKLARTLAGDEQDKTAKRRRAPKFTDEMLLQSFFGAGADGERLLMGGDKRLAALLRKAALGHSY